MDLLSELFLVLADTPAVLSLNVAPETNKRSNSL